jgi:hypothetical protein
VGAPGTVQLLDADAGFVAVHAKKTAPKIFEKVNWNEPLDRMVGLALAKPDRSGLEFACQHDGCQGQRRSQIIY